MRGGTGFAFWACSRRFSCRAGVSFERPSHSLSSRTRPRLDRQGRTIRARAGARTLGGVRSRPDRGRKNTIHHPYDGIERAHPRLGCRTGRDDVPAPALHHGAADDAADQGAGRGNGRAHARRWKTINGNRQTGGSSMFRHPDPEVLVVGAGPVGLVTALFLRQ